MRELGTRLQGWVRAEMGAGRGMNGWGRGVGLAGMALGLGRGLEMSGGAPGIGREARVGRQRREGAWVRVASLTWDPESGPSVTS